MINSIEDLRSAGVLPTGPCSAWPQERNVPGESMKERWNNEKHDKKVEVGLRQMASNLAASTSQAVANGKVSQEIRDERYNTCLSCKHFIEESKRCSQCGCFMEAKTWIGGNPNSLCPKQKWIR